VIITETMFNILQLYHVQWVYSYTLRLSAMCFKRQTSPDTGKHLWLLARCRPLRSCC